MLILRKLTTGIKGISATSDKYTDVGGHASGRPRTEKIFLTALPNTGTFAYL